MPAWPAPATTLRFVAGDSEQAGRLHALAGQLAYHLNDDADAMADFERAIAIAEPLGDEATVATSRCFYGAALLVTNEVERGTELARLGAEAAARLGLYPLVAEGARRARHLPCGRGGVRRRAGDARWPGSRWRASTATSPARPTR